MNIINFIKKKVYDNELLKSTDFHTFNIETITSLLYKSEYEIKEHCYRVAKLSIFFGHALSFSCEQLRQLYLLALFHDVGKILISDELFRKNNPLTEEEWKVIRKHPEFGFQITQLCVDTIPISIYILAHHENWDGSGYPDGTKGKNIPYMSRIVSIIDAFDAMTSKRSYRSTICKEAALQEIIRCSGSQFDPDLVQLFIEKVFNSLNNEITNLDNVDYNDLIWRYINGESS